MLTDDEISDLLGLPKIIERKEPAAGYAEADGYRRCRLRLRARSESGEAFSVFIRQNIKFIENFSIA